MVVDLGELDEHGNIAVTEVARRVKDALDVEKVTKKFYEDYKNEHVRFVELIEGIDDERDRQWYASVLLNRLMFIYFLQRKYFIDKGDGEYLQRRLEATETSDPYWYYTHFLRTLFFEGFAKPEHRRSAEAKKLLGQIKFLNGGLFLPHSIEEKYGSQIRIKNQAFENILNLFKRYSWNLNDTPGQEDNEIRPDVLGYIFEKYINQKAFGAYYTRTEITEYLCEQTINKLIIERINDLLTGSGPGTKTSVKYETMADLLFGLDAFLCRQLLEILPTLSILDPACGSGAFLVAALKTLMNIYGGVIGRIEVLSDRYLRNWLRKAHEEHPSVAYFIKKRIITDNLFGVDIMEEASEIAKLRLFLTLVASADKVDQLEPLPNIDFNLLTGNSLIGLMHVDDKEFDQRHAQGNLFRKSYRELLAETKRKIENYKKNDAYSDTLVDLRDEIKQLKKETSDVLDEILLAEFQKLGIKFEQATWDEKKNKEGKSVKRPLKLSDINALKPFHWGFEFDEIINRRGGFDIILTNPPWETFQPDAKEFFAEHSQLVFKKKMDLREFEIELKKLIKDKKIKEAWLSYRSKFPHQRELFRFARQYENQVPIIDGKRHGKDVNLFKLFVEQNFNLLRFGGLCGLVIPSGIYTDLGAKQLRKLLFEKTRITGLLGFENRRQVFDGVHRSFKFSVLTFEKGGPTREFPAAFMRTDISELQGFPGESALIIDTDLVIRLSPNSLSITEFKNVLDLEIADKALRFPVLGQQVDGCWNIELHRELNATDDATLFQKKESVNSLPLYEGKTLHQFTHKWSEPRYWIDKGKGRRALLGTESDRGQILNYQKYRLGYRDIASSTNERTMIAAILPRDVFTVNTLVVSHQPEKEGELLLLVALLNSFVADYMMRQKVTSHCNMFYVYQLLIPRLTSKAAAFVDIVQRSSRLICTTPEFDDLAKEVGLKSHKDGANDPTERARLRAELDGMIAHLYGLTEEEFTHILSTFPLVEQSVKDAALDAYREFAPKPGDQEIAALIAKGESNTLEFKATARWDIKQNKANPAMEQIVVKTAAALLNTDGGNLLIGVDDERNVVGLAHDYKLFSKPDKRDAYENFLTTLLLTSFGKDTSALISISIHEVDSKDVARVAVKASPKPVYDKDGHLYIRAGNSTRQLNPKETVDYCKMHWT